MAKENNGTQPNNIWVTYEITDAFDQTLPHDAENLAKNMLASRVDEYLMRTKTDDGWVGGGKLGTVLDGTTYSNPGKLSQDEAIKKLTDEFSEFNMGSLRVEKVVPPENAGAATTDNPIIEGIVIKAKVPYYGKL